MDAKGVGGIRCRRLRFAIVLFFIVKRNRKYRKYKMDDKAWVVRGSNLSVPFDVR